MKPVMFVNPKTLERFVPKRMAGLSRSIRIAGVDFFEATPRAVAKLEAAVERMTADAGVADRVKARYADEMAEITAWAEEHWGDTAMRTARAEREQIDAAA